MSHTLKAGEKINVSAKPGISSDVRIVLGDGTEIATTLAPGITMTVTAGEHGNAVNVYLDGAQSGPLRVVD